ncbi:general secretion pathway protein G [Nitrospirillum viridazoti Y2]|uniref:Type II secretion system core protein G n=1 Tax=Nitrospirillum amazonense TaxID=28077 RepID=A0A560IU83_9PROT|nr:type II secretion system major pseudopilin GspG [Nitrospirillum amazonense]EGY00082.1 general secretion pathway protein G [Nitrospirillum amazonense Y2]TWB60544.1 general secretion pathway protein G [Nitrospirillum amazonense]
MTSPSDTLDLNSIFRRDRGRQRGFTLVEVLVVLVIIGLLGLLVAPNLVARLGKAKGEAAQAQINTLVAAVDLFYVDVGRYPTTQEGLEALVTAPAGDASWRGPYLRKRQALIDPWGNAYRYKVPGDHGAYDIFTYGSDNAPGGEGDARDVTSW